MPTENEDGSQNPSDTQQPQPPSDADAKINNAINSAVTAHLKRFAEKQLPAMLQPMLEAAVKPIHEKLAAPTPEPEDKKAKDKQSPEMQALQAKLAEFEARVAKETAAREAAEKKSRDERAKSELRNALQSHVKPELLDMLSDNLFHLKGVVDYEEDGSIVFKSKKVDTWGAEEEVRMPLKAGVEQFLKSSEAKPFLPAPGGSSAPQMRKQAQSGGSQNGPVDPTKLSERDKIAKAMEIAERLQQQQR